MEDFVNQLNRNEIKNRGKFNYKGSTKADIKKFLRQFYKWYKGRNEFYPEEVAWIKTRISKDEKPKQKEVLSIDEVEKFANSFENIQYKMLILLLFDSGFRIDEMLSVKKRNLTWEEFDEQGNKCFWIECNRSKTVTRKVPIPLFTEDVKDFCNSTYFRSLEENQEVFGKRYTNVRIFMARKSQEVLRKNITPHCLRHSSATYYAKEYDGNMNMIAMRYGWTLGSDELALYIRQSGAYQKQGAKKVYENDITLYKRKLTELENQLQKQNVKDTKQEDQLKTLQEEIQKLHEEQKQMFNIMKEINTAKHKNLVKTIFQERAQKETN
jgi:integrase